MVILLKNAVWTVLFLREISYHTHKFSPVRLSHLIHKWSVDIQLERQIGLELFNLIQYWTWNFHLYYHCCYSLFECYLYLSVLVFMQLTLVISSTKCLPSFNTYSPYLPYMPFDLFEIMLKLWNRQHLSLLLKQYLKNHEWKRCDTNLYVCTSWTWTFN